MEPESGWITAGVCPRGVCSEGRACFMMGVGLGEEESWARGRSLLKAIAPGSRPFLLTEQVRRDIGWPWDLGCVWRAGTAAVATGLLCALPSFSGLQKGPQVSALRQQRGRGQQRQTLG